MYQAGLLRLLTQSDYNTLNTKINNNYNTLNNNVSTKTQIVTGSYIGDNNDIREIDIGFYSKAVLVVWEGYRFSRSEGYMVFGGLALRNNPVCIKGVEAPIEVIAITSDGFKTTDTNDSALNQKDIKYHYIAFK